MQCEVLRPLTLPPCRPELTCVLGLELREILQTKYGVRGALEPGSLAASKIESVFVEETTELESLR